MKTWRLHISALPLKIKPSRLLSYKDFRFLYTSWIHSSIILFPFGMSKRNTPCLELKWCTKFYGLLSLKGLIFDSLNLDLVVIEDLYWREQILNFWKKLPESHAITHETWRQIQPTNAKVQHQPGDNREAGCKLFETQLGNPQQVSLAIVSTFQIYHQIRKKELEHRLQQYSSYTIIITENMSRNWLW